MPSRATLQIQLDYEAFSHSASSATTTSATPTQIVIDNDDLRWSGRFSLCIDMGLSLQEQAPVKGVSLR
jgi:hypothetical protein